VRDAFHLEQRYRLGDIHSEYVCSTWNSKNNRIVTLFS
jgi:hypothetical protein